MEKKDCKFEQHDWVFLKRENPREKENFFVIFSALLYNALNITANKHEKHSLMKQQWLLTISNDLGYINFYSFDIWIYYT